MLDGIVSFFLLIALGYVLIRSGLLSQEAPRHLSSLLMTVCFPAMILKSFLAVDPRSLLSTSLSTVIVTLVFSLLPSLFFRLKKKRSPSDPLYSFICGIGNVSFVCIPLLRLFLTEEEMLPVYLHVSIQDLLIWGLFHPAFAGKHSRGSLKKLLTEPCFIAVVAGLLLSISGIPLPKLLTLPLDALDACVSPLALLFLGMTIARYGLLSWIGSRRSVYYSLYKVLLYPILILLLLLPFLPLREALLLSILFGSPAPVAAVVWMQNYTSDPSPAIHCLIPSTLLYFLLYTPALLLLTQSATL